MNTPRADGMWQPSTAGTASRHAHAIAAVAATHLRSLAAGLLPTMQRAWNSVAAGLKFETTTASQSRSREDPTIVAALCMCVLGEWKTSAAWPPRSVAELSGGSGSPQAGKTQDRMLLEQGLDALDELALHETGRCFARLDRRAQLRSLFQLEAGQGRLSRRHASAFMDAFLIVAAQAYLRDSL